ncbi:MAG: hypothetical protein ACREMS_02625 [Gemmatimonadaceae bacterium]
MTRIRRADPQVAPPGPGALNDFDSRALYAAMDAQRTDRGLSWSQLAKELWDQSVVLNRRRDDHPISPATLTGIGKRANCSCQHALVILRWLGRSPEAFMLVPPSAGATALPSAGPDVRLRWDLSAVYAAMDERRRERHLTWRELAKDLRCSEHQLQGLRTVRFAIGMKLMMRIVHWLEQPAASFIYAARW